MRTTYHEQLTALCTRIGDMCGMAADALEQATHALVEADLPVAEAVISDHEHLAALCRQTEDNAIKLLALQQPVATDLRSIVGSIHIAADIERMGALAVHVANIARRRHPDCALPADLREYFAEMGSAAVQLARMAQEVLLSRDPAKAAQLREKDDAVDTRHRELFTLLLDHNWRSGVSCAVDVALLGRFYERFADHAVEIGRRVVFEATGGLPLQKQMV
jgi:phosphate transport system protein